MNRKNLENREIIFFKLGLCNILKLKNNFIEAYQVVDEIIQLYPFAMEARFMRGSILGLIGQPKKGLEDLPESRGSRSFGEWLRYYYRGLLLLKLGRHEDAKKNLVEEFSKTLASGEEKEILRMAAALWYLKYGDPSEADSILSQVSDLDDYYIQYLSLVLKMHLAAQKKDLNTINSLRMRISKIRVVDVKLEKAVAAIDEGNFSLAIECETDALLAA